MTIGRNGLKKITELLSQDITLVSSGQVYVEAEFLLKEAYYKIYGIDLTRFDFYQKLAQEISDDVIDVGLKWAKMRISGAPVQQITQSAFFNGARYRVGPSTLIPRPETEILLHLVIEWLGQKNINQNILGFELGLGTGIISIELLRAQKNLQMISTETHPQALEIAQQNLEHYIKDSKKRAQFLLSENKDQFFEPISTNTQFDFIVSNPPYLLKSNKDFEVTQEVFNYESHVALFAPEEDSIFYYKKLLLEGMSYLKPEGVFFFEIPHERKSLIQDFVKRLGLKMEFYNDLTQRVRCIKIWGKGH